MDVPTPNLTDLPQHERACLLVLALQGLPVARSHWAEQLKRWDVRKPGSSARGRRARTTRAISSADLSVLVEASKAQGWLVEAELHYGSQLGYRCTGPVAHALMDDPSLATFRAGIRDSVLAQLAASPAWSRDRELTVMAARLSCYADGAGLEEFVCEAERTRHDRSACTLDELLPGDSPRAAVERLPAPLQSRWLGQTIASSVARLVVPDPAVVELGFERGLDDLESGLSAAALALGCLVGPQRSWERALAPVTTEPARSACALAALMRGEFELARERAEQALELSRGPQRRRKPLLTGYSAPLLTLLLATGNAEQQARALTQLQRATRQDGYLADDYAAAQCLMPDGSATSPLLFLRRGVTAFQAMMLLTAASFIHEGGHETASKLAGQLHELWARVGLTSLACEAARLEARFAPHRPGRRSDDGGWLAMGRLKQEWERVLDAVDALAPAPAKSPSNAEAVRKQRLVFEVSLLNGSSSAEGDWDDEFLDDEPDEELGDSPDGSSKYLSLSVQPRLQTRRGNGYTAGRNVALSTLASRMGTLEYLTEHDRRVAACIQVNRGWYGERQYRFASRVAEALVGHPCVFWADGPRDHPVQVLTGGPRLVVQRCSEGMTLRVEPAVDKSGIGVYRDGQGQLFVVEMSPKQRGVQRALAAMPPVPSHGEARMKASLGKLAQAFTVHSDEGGIALGPEARAVDADARPVVLLSRDQPGFVARVHVRPLGSGGPSFAVARGPRTVAAAIESEPRTCERDFAQEEAALSALHALAPQLQAAASSSGYRCDTLASCLQLLSALREAGEQVVVEWVGADPVLIEDTLDVASLRLELRDDAGGWLQMQGQLAVDEQRVVSLQQALADPLLNAGFLPLGEGRFASLDAGLRDGLLGLSAAVPRAAGKPEESSAPLRLPLAALGFAGSWFDRPRHCKASAATRRKLAAVQKAYASEPQVPVTLDAELRTYQVQGFQFLARLSAFGAGACLADDMGLGKTVMALALLLDRAESGPALVVAPTSVCGNWLQEMVRFAPALRPLEPPGSGGDVCDLGPFDVVVCSYSRLTQRIDALAAIAWGTVILDEAQAIKNPATQRAKAATRLSAGARVAMTGTPVENHLGDVYSLMRFLNPGLLGTLRQFQERFVKPIQRDGDARASSELRSLLRPFLLRRRKSEVLRELPPRTEITVRVEPDASEREFVEALRRAALERLSEGPTGGGAAVSILAEITRLRRAACHPTLADAQAGRGVGAAKLERLMTLLKDLRDGGHRTLVFSQFVGFLKLAEARLREEGLSWQYLDGSTPEKRRREAVARFQAGEGDVFLISLKAGGFGLNLTAADYVVHVDPWWNPAVEAQASDRAHRIGQTRPVTVYRLVNVGSIEERVIGLHARKRKLAEDVLQEADDPSKLNTAALMQLLSGEERVRSSTRESGRTTTARRA